LLIAEHCDDPLGCRYLHTQELLPDDCIEFVHEFSAENHEVSVINVDHIKGESLCSGIVEISEGNKKRYLSDWLYWFSSETLQWVFRRVQQVWLRFIFLKFFKNKMFAELPLSTRTFPMIQPAMFTLMTMHHCESQISA
jgi:hypothetical protein